NYANVYLKLEPYRERLIKVGMIASGLYELATAEPEQVEQVLSASEAGEVMTVADIKQRLGRQAPVATPDDGGPAGLRAAAAEKVSFATKSLLDTLYGMLRDAHVALEPLQQGKTVAVGEAKEALVHPARLADGLVKSLVFSAQSHWNNVPGMVDIRAVNENRWRNLHLVLTVVGDGQSWPT